MTLLSMLDRFEQAAVTYETSTDKADRDELHAARRAIMEREAELIKERDEARKKAGKLHDYANMRDVQIVAAVAREAELVKALKAAVRAANLALFVIRKQGVMPNSSWEGGFKDDLAR